MGFIILGLYLFENKSLATNFFYLNFYSFNLKLLHYFEMIKNSEILKFFPEPVFKYKLDNYNSVNTELIKYIYDLKQKDEKGLERSNVHGWHSKNFNLKDTNSIQHKFLVSLKEYIFDVFEKYGWNIDPKKIVCTDMWAIVNKRNSFNVIHTHPNSYLSAAYYVKAPESVEILC